MLAWLFSLGADFASPIDAQLQQSGFPLDAIRGKTAPACSAPTCCGRCSLFWLRGAFCTSSCYASCRLRPPLLVMGSLTLVDLWAVDKRYLNDSNFQRETVTQQFLPTAVDQQILQDKDLSYRVLNLSNPFNEANTSYFHKSIGGYHGAKLRRYQDLIERQISQNNKQVLNMLNTRYLITPPNPQANQPAKCSATPVRWATRGL